jgi:hypothetical protein
MKVIIKWGYVYSYRLHIGNDIVTYRSIARQRLGKHIPAGANARNNWTSAAMQRVIKQVFSTRERLCFLRGPFRGVIKGQRKSFELVVRSWQSSVEEEFIWMICCQELGRVLEMAVEGDWEEMARKELDWDKKTSCVIWSYSETVINPLPGHD